MLPYLQSHRRPTTLPQASPILPATATTTTTTTHKTPGSTRFSSTLPPSLPSQSQSNPITSTPPSYDASILHPVFFTSRLQQPNSSCPASRFGINSPYGQFGGIGIGNNPKLQFNPAAYGYIYLPAHASETGAPHGMGNSKL